MNIRNWMKTTKSLLIQFKHPLSFFLSMLSTHCPPVTWPTSLTPVTENSLWHQYYFVVCDYNRTLRIESFDVNNSLSEIIIHLHSIKVFLHFVSEIFMSYSFLNNTCVIISLSIISCSVLSITILFFSVLCLLCSQMQA